MIILFGSFCLNAFFQAFLQHFFIFSADVVLIIPIPFLRYMGQLFNGIQAVYKTALLLLNKKKLESTNFGTFQT